MEHAPGIYYRSKMIFITPKIIVLNELDRPILLSQY